MTVEQTFDRWISQHGHACDSGTVLVTTERLKELWYGLRNTHVDLAASETRADRAHDALAEAHAQTTRAHDALDEIEAWAEDHLKPMHVPIIRGIRRRFFCAPPCDEADAQAQDNVLADEEPDALTIRAQNALDEIEAWAGRFENLRRRVSDLERTVAT